MDTVKEIEIAISRLAREDLRRLREWFMEFDAAQWDAEFERDVAAGNLDPMADEAIAAKRQGKQC